MLPKEAAAKLGMSVKTLLKHCDDGRLRFINIGTATRKVRRFTNKNLETFKQNQKVREIPKCLSISIKTHPSTAMSSSSTVVDFVALQAAKTKRTQ